MSEASNKSYRYLPILAMVYVTIIISVCVLSNKIIIIAGHLTMAGTLFIPFWFILSDIITEIYGYKISRQIIWFVFPCLFLFSLICTIALHIPSPRFWHGQSAYELVLGDLMRITASGLIAYLISGAINIYLLVKWKFLLKGRYFLLRSFCASTIGELIYTAMAVVMIQYHILTWSEMGKIIITAYTIKVICTLLSAFPASFIVSFLRENEINIETDDHINPFKKMTAENT